MNRNILRTPVSAAGMTARTSRQLITMAGEGLIHRIDPNYIPPEVETIQTGLKRSIGRSGIAAYSSDDASLEKVAQTAVDSKVVQPGDLVEVGGMLSDRSLRNPELMAGFRAAIGKVTRKLVKGFGITARPNSHAVLLPADLESADTNYSAWRQIFENIELLRTMVSLEKDIDRELTHRHVSTLTIGLPDEVTTVFRGKVFNEADQADGGLLILRRLGRIPINNVWLPATADIVGRRQSLLARSDQPVTT